MNKNKRLLKDIVIPAGTIFECIDGVISHYYHNNYGHTLGLTKNSSGKLVYCVDDEDTELNEWFEECESI